MNTTPEFKGVKGARRLRCLHCNLFFDSASHLKRHIQEMHPPKSDDATDFFSGCFLMTAAGVVMWIAIFYWLLLPVWEFAKRLVSIMF